MTTIQDYNINTDPTYLLVIKNRIDNKQTKRKIDNVNLLQIAGEVESLDEDTIKSLGMWNSQLIDYVRQVKNDEKIDQRERSNIESFASLGILLIPMKGYGGDKRYFFMIIPPYLSIYWADYIKYINRAAIQKISMNDARTPIRELNAHLDQYFSQSILDTMVYRGENSDTIRQFISNTVDTTLGLLNTSEYDKKLEGAYVGVLFYSVVNSKDDMLAENIMAHITEMIVKPMKEQKMVRLEKSPKSLTSNDVAKIVKANNAKLISTKSTWMEPLYALYAEPIPTAISPLPLSDKYIQSVPALQTDLPESLRESQKCAEGYCEFPAQTRAAGFVLSGDGDTDITSIDIDCNTYDPVKMSVLGESFSMKKQEGQDNIEYCEEVKRVIQDIIRSK